MASIDWFEKVFLIRRVEIYRQGVLERLMDAFKNMVEEAEQIAQEHLDMLTKAPSGWSETPSDRVDEANDVAVDYLLDMSWLRQQTLNNATAGLYHIWERDLKALLDRTVVLGAGEDTAEIERANFNGLVSILKKYGYEFEQQSCYERMDELRLVTNTLKHGVGPAHEQLGDRRPDLWPQSKDTGLTVIGPPENLEIQEQHFCEFADAVKEFWKTVDIVY